MKHDPKRDGLAVLDGRFEPHLSGRPYRLFVQPGGEPAHDPHLLNAAVRADQDARVHDAFNLQQSAM